MPSCDFKFTSYENCGCKDCRECIAMKQIKSISAQLIVDLKDIKDDIKDIKKIIEEEESFGHFSDPDSPEGSDDDTFLLHRDEDEKEEPNIKPGQTIEGDKVQVDEKGFFSLK